MSSRSRRLAMSTSRVSCRKLVAIPRVKKSSRTLTSRWPRRQKNQRDKQRRIRRKNNRMAVNCQMINTSSNINNSRTKFWRPLMHRPPKPRKPKACQSLPVTINNSNNNQSHKTPTPRSNHNRNPAPPKSRRKSNSSFKRSKFNRMYLLWWKCNPWLLFRVKLNYSRLRRSHKRVLELNLRLLLLVVNNQLIRKVLRLRQPPRLVKAARGKGRRTRPLSKMPWTSLSRISSSRNDHLKSLKLSSPIQIRWKRKSIKVLYMGVTIRTILSIMNQAVELFLRKIQWLFSTKRMIKSSLKTRRISINRIFIQPWSRTSLMTPR